MANDLVGSPGAKPLVALALDLRGWEQAEEREGDPDEAIAIIDRWLVPMKESDGLNGEAARRLVERLRLIGTKIAPSMSEEQVNVWLSAMEAALSDLPARVAIKAAEEALHVPAKFVNEVEGIIRDKAEGVRSRYELARSRLARMKREIERAAKPVPALAPLPPLTDEALQSMPEPLRSIGIAKGWIEEDTDGRLSWKKEEGK